MAYDPSGGYVSQTFNYNFVRGLDPVDDLSMFPGTLYRLLDGSYRNRIKNFCRRISVGLGVQNDYNDRLFLGRFAVTETKKITITYDNPVDEATKNIVTIDADSTPNVVSVQVTGHSYVANDQILVADVVAVSPSVNTLWRLETIAANTFELVDCTGRTGTGGAVGTVQRMIHSLTETDLQVVLLNPETFTTQWINGSEYSRSSVLELVEKTARTSFPS